MKKTILRTILFLFLLVAFFYIAAFIWESYSIYHGMYRPIKEESAVEKEKKTVSIQDQPIALLLLGIDQRKNSDGINDSGDPGRTDAIVVVLLHPKTKEVLLFNIPRDTLVEIVGKQENLLDKINHAYFFGGAKMTIQTVEKFLAIPINYYIKMNMNGFQEWVNLFGGIEVQVPFSFDLSGTHFEKGLMFMDGPTALKYVRMRKQDPKGDFGRHVRLQQVTIALVEKTFGKKTQKQLVSVLANLGKHMETNLHPLDFFTLYQEYGKLDKSKITSFKMQGVDMMREGIYYYSVGEEERAKIQQKLRDFLGE